MMIMRNSALALCLIDLQVKVFRTQNKKIYVVAYFEMVCRKKKKNSSTPGKVGKPQMKCDRFSCANV